MNHLERKLPLTTPEYLEMQAQELREKVQRRQQEDFLAKLAGELKALPHDERIARLLESTVQIMSMAYDTRSYREEPFHLIKAFEILLREAQE